MAELPTCKPLDFWVVLQAVPHDNNFLLEGLQLLIVAPAIPAHSRALQEQTMHHVCRIVLFACAAAHTFSKQDNRSLAGLDKCSTQSN